MVLPVSQTSLLDWILSLYTTQHTSIHRQSVLLPLETILVAFEVWTLDNERCRESTAGTFINRLLGLVLLWMFRIVVVYPTSTA